MCYAAIKNYAACSHYGASTGNSHIVIPPTFTVPSFTDGIYYIHQDHLGSYNVCSENGERNTGDRMIKYSYSFCSYSFIRSFPVSPFPVLRSPFLRSPLPARFFSPDPFVQMPDFTQSYNRYSYCLNNPLMYSDPSGYKIKWWGWMLMGMGLLDPMTASVTAVSAGTTIAATAVTVAGAAYGTTVANIPIIAGIGLFKNYDGAGTIRNSFRITNGLFATDKNRSFWARTWQFASRFSWEALQTTVGVFYTQGKNIGGQVDRVDYLGGATYATKENYSGNFGGGVTLGNYININTSGKITGNFEDYVLNNPLYMHEFGHTFDSRTFGFTYLFAVGIPSLVSASKDEYITKWDGVEVENLLRLSSHDIFWTETRANKHAAKYFKKYYGIDWEKCFSGYPLSNPFK